MISNKDEVLLSIQNAYINLKHPDFHFVMDKYKSVEYKSIIGELSTLFNISEVTDLNYDVCISLDIDVKDEVAHLYLSLVGKYAFIIYKDNVISYCNKEGEKLNNLINVLLQHQFTLLSRDELLYEIDSNVDMSCFYDDEKKPMLLGFLFSFGLVI